MKDWKEIMDSKALPSDRLDTFVKTTICRFQGNMDRLRIGETEPTESGPG